MLSLGDRVRNLLGRYCDLVDAGDWAGVGALFAGGRLTSGGHVLAEGADAVAGFYAGGTQLHGGAPRTKHVVANTQLDAGAGATVVARSSFVVLQAVEGSLALQPVIAGRYVDTFDVDADGEPTWRERSFEVDLSGDLTHHLTRALPGS